MSNSELAFEDDDNASLSDTNKLLPLPTGQSDVPGSSRSMASIEYYQQYFDVDTEQVLSRIKASMWPLQDDFLHRIKNRADLYGPLWISTTLIFVLAMAGNIVEWQTINEENRPNWRYDFSKVSFAATTIYTYVTLMPFIIWAFVRSVKIFVSFIIIQSI